MGISNYVEKREHEITEYFMEPQQILPAFVSHLGSKNSIEPGPPHEALFFVLAYLDVFELLVMSEVCMPLRDAVSKDVLPWRNIIIERPLNSRLSDEISDDGLQTVIEKNHLISKLHIPGCSGLTPRGNHKSCEDTIPTSQQLGEFTDKRYLQPEERTPGNNFFPSSNEPTAAKATAYPVSSP
ncbi:MITOCHONDRIAL ATP SYNTHASE COUPLING FACTOR B [Salix koriyanagi]|uniref:MITOCHONDRIAL ATP SYNTHASE COUPLING FACTOR B n=1 Tax=Salix koriyanagi TaxID=2511006 RepID=A0A9Q0WRP6_9ROSI|nr:MITOCHONDRIAL ATP SYNTHASE COUPLING FACTOR B [Salix koriyanagi]